MIMQRPITLWFLIFFLAFLGLGGFYGGIAMLTDPTGGSLQMADVLPLLPVPDYVLPGLFLLVVMGITPFFLIYALITRPGWIWAQALSHLTGHHWAWLGTLVVGIGLIVWLSIQGVLIGFKWPIQYITGCDGLLIILSVLTPKIRKYYALPG
jgi:hypothetical protein